MREASGQELGDGACQAAAVKIQLPQLWEDTGLIRHRPLQMLISDVQIGDIPVARQGGIICRKEIG